MTFSSLSVLLVLALANDIQSLDQHSEGRCSPNSAVGKGSVFIGVIVCPDDNKEAEKWKKKYCELKAVPVPKCLKDEDELAQQTSQAFKDGDLEQAGELVDKMLERREKSIECTAAIHFIRGLIYQQQSLLFMALPHLEKAYRYRPTNKQYSNAYAKLLHDLNRSKISEPIYSDNLERFPKLADANPSTYLTCGDNRQ